MGIDAGYGGAIRFGDAHDFNNILVPINLYTGMAMKKLAPDSKLYATCKRYKKLPGAPLI